MPSESSTGHLHSQRFQTTQHPNAAKMAAETLSAEGKPFNDHLAKANEQIENMKRAAMGYMSGGIASGSSSETGNLSQINGFLGGSPLQLGGQSALGDLSGAGDVGQISPNNPVLDAFMPGLEQMQTMMGKLGSDMLQMVQQLIASIQTPKADPNHLSKWDDRSKHEMLGKMRRNAPRLADAYNDVAQKSEIPLGPVQQQELTRDLEETSQSISVVATAYVHFAMEGYVESADGITELHDKLDTEAINDDPTLAAQQASGATHSKMMISFEMTIVTFFEMSIETNKHESVPQNDALSSIQDKLRNYFESRDTESANRIVDQINAILDAEETKEADALANEINNTEGVEDETFEQV